MKTLYFADMEFKAERIVKFKDSIVGYIGDSEVFSLKGISDFSQFKLAEGEEFDKPQLSEVEQLKLDVSKNSAELLDLVLNLTTPTTEPTGGN